MKKLCYCLVLFVFAAATAQAITLPVTDQLIIHLKADSLSLSDGAAVTSWADSATSDTVNGTVSTVAGYTTPVFKANIYNGKPVVRFSDDILCTATQFTLPNPTGGVTMFALFKGGSSGLATERLAQIGDSAGSGGKVVGMEVSTNKADADGGSGFRFNNGRALARTANPLTTGWHRACWKMAQGAQHSTAVYRVDGAQKTLDSINNPTNTTTLQTTGNIFSLGTGMLTGGWITTDYYGGDVAEIIVYNRQLTTTEIQQVEDYLSFKYEEPMPGVSGLIIQLKASEMALANNAAVTSWADSATGDSVNGAVSSVVGQGTPVFVRSAINGWPAVRFVSAELDLLKSGLFSWDQTKGVTVFMVTTGGLSTPQRAMQIGKSGGTVNKSFGCDVSSSVSGVRYNNGYCTATSPFADGEWHISIRQMEQGGGYGGTFYGVDDIPLCKTSTNAAGENIAFDASDNDISVGAGGQNGGWCDYYDGDIAEVLVYNRQLKQSEMKQIRSYLNNKYNTYPYTWGEKFTIVAIPDSQGYIEQGDGYLFNNEMQYIVDNVNAKNIVFATHEGDFMTSSTTAHYQAANTGMQRLLNTIPIAMVPGNHDYDDTNPSHNSTLWNTYFGPTTDYFRDKSWYGGYADNNTDSDGMTMYQEFSTAEIDFLHISFELNPSDARLAWAQGVINSHPGWPTIITTHSFLSVTDASRQGAGERDPYARNTAQQMWDEFIKVNPQIFMVLCGHSFDAAYGAANRRTDNNNAGYPVYQIIADYQGCYSGSGLGNGGGWIRLMEVNPVANNVRVRTYSTILNKYADDASLKDGSTYARQWAKFNYANQGTGALLAESNSKSSTFTIPFIYGKQLPMP